MQTKDRSSIENKRTTIAYIQEPKMNVMRERKGLKGVIQK